MKRVAAEKVWFWVHIPISMAINLTLQITQDDRFGHFGSSPGPFVANISSVRLVRSYLERAVSEQ